MKKLTDDEKSLAIVAYTRLARDFSYYSCHNLYASEEEYQAARAAVFASKAQLMADLRQEA